MQLPSGSRFRLCETSDGSWQLLRAGEKWVTYLGFDPESRGFVSVSFSSGIENRAFGQEDNAIFQRLEGIINIEHPTVGKVHDIGESSFGNSYCVAELVEGEPLFEYLTRNPDLPEDLLACILLDLADALGILAKFPRFLSCVEPNDFLVTLDRGIFPALRLGRFGLNRSDQPASDFQLAERWMQWTAGIHMAMREGKNPADSREQGQQHPRYAELESNLNRKSGVDAILHLKELNSAIREVADIGGEPGYAVPIKHRKLSHIKQAAYGPIQEFLYQNSDLESLIQEKFECLKNEIRYGVSPFLIPAAKRMEEGGQEKTGEAVQLYLLPPERLFEESVIDPLNRKMFDGYLKSHPNGVRVRSLICESDFILLVADRFEGLPLPCFQARRAKFSSGDALAVVRQLDRVRCQFESARFPLGRLSPWQVELYFESAGPEDIPDLIEKTPIEDWPAWDLKLRVEAPAETFVEPVFSAWSHLIGRFQKRSFPAIFVWLLEGDRFEWDLRNSNAADEPLNWNPNIANFLEEAAMEFNEFDPAHRSQLIEYFSRIFERHMDPSESAQAGKSYFGKPEKAPGKAQMPIRKLSEDRGTVR